MACTGTDMASVSIPAPPQDILDSLCCRRASDARGIIMEAIEIDEVGLSVSPWGSY